MKLPAVERPNGTLYRPRKLRSQVLGNEDETTGIVVFGTHDVAAALSVARLDVRAANREYGYNPDDEQYVLEEGTARRVWWSQKLSHFEEFDQAVYYYSPDEERGWAGVEFEVTWGTPTDTCSTDSRTARGD